MRPLVSVVIPVFNAEALIGEAVDSVLAQTLDDLELIVVDDCSTDGTWQVLQRFRDDGRVSLQQNAKNLGMGGNWDRATGLASGKYLKLLCADDALRPTCLAEQADPLECDSSLSFVASRRDIIDDRGRILLRNWGLRGLIGTHQPGDVRRKVVRSGTNALGEPSAALVRRDTLTSAGSWEVPVRYLTDLDMWFRLLDRGAFHGIEKSLSAFRVWPGSLSTSAAKEQSAQFRQFAFAARAQHPEITGTDLALGAMRSRTLQPLRRVVFWKASRGR